MWDRDLGENTHLFWVTVRDALAQIDRDTLQTIYPTRRNIERLAQFRNFAEALDQVAAVEQRTISPWVDARPK